MELMYEERDTENRSMFVRLFRPNVAITPETFDMPYLVNIKEYRDRELVHSEWVVVEREALLWSPDSKAIREAMRLFDEYRAKTGDGAAKELTNVEKWLNTLIDACESAALDLEAAENTINWGGSALDLIDEVRAALSHVALEAKEGLGGDA